MSTDALPSELLVAPQPLIGLCGLDVQRNAVHKTVWDAFSINRKADRAGVQFKLLPPNYEFPIAKPKRASYEWYQPKGILKRNWMLKHLHVLPSVVVLFQDMEWNDQQWTERQVQCAATLQALKNALQERNTRICLVLLQKSAPLPPGEDLLASERAASLTTACGINSKMLFVLPHTEHLMGYTLRLESAFMDMAQSYYALMSKRIRTHRDQLTAAHTTLKIRHQFKLGFVAEMRQDFSTALKHYTQAYANLDEIRITDANCLEIKTIAGFLNYKMCRLMFKLKVPRDAINHFIGHIEKYKNRIGFKDLIFEHYAWLSTQHNMFAELFCEAIKNGLPALQTQHPGIYFHKAAEYMVKRREAFLQSCAVLLSPTEPSSPTTLQNNNSMALYTEYFGIRAIKTGEPISEQQINSLIRETEKNFNHSSAIINLLSQAMAQFKIYKCLRFRKKLAIDMADEYFKSGDHAKALTLYSLMLPDYRQDKWSSIFSDVLLKTLHCALLSASVTDYISCSLEALSLKISYEQKERIIVLENLWKVFQGVPPVSQTQFSPEIRDLWESTLTTVKSPIPVDLDKITDLLDMYATFECIELKNDEIINLHLIVKLRTDVPIKMRSFAILLSDGANNFRMQSQKYITFNNLLELRVHHEKDTTSTANVTYKHAENDLKLEPGVYYQFHFSVEAQQFVENTQLRVIRIEAQMGTDKLSALLMQSATFAPQLFRQHDRCKDLNDNMPIYTLCYIIPTFHLVTQTNLDNEVTMLVNEYYAVVTTISNPYNVFLQNVGMNVSVPTHLRNKVFLTTDVSPSRQKMHSQIQIDIGELSMQSSNTISYYIFSLVETTVTLQQRVWYVIDVPPIKPTNSLTLAKDNLTQTSAENSPENAAASNIATMANPIRIASPVQIELLDESRWRKTREITLSAKCQLEFSFIGRFYSVSRKALTRVYRGEDFLFRVNIEVQSPSPLDILESYFICDHNLTQSTYSFKRKKSTKTYEKGEALEDVIVLRANATLDDWLTAKEFERNRSNPQSSNVFNRLGSSRKPHSSGQPSRGESAPINMNKSLMSKLPTNVTIISNTANLNPQMAESSNMNSSTISDDGRVASMSNESDQHVEGTAQAQKLLNSRVMYNKALDGVQATGHCRGFLKGAVITEQQQQTQPPHSRPYFGIYCIKWRRQGSGIENESKFVISGREIEVPPLNIYSTIEEKMFVKMPMAFKVTLKNPTSRVLHLIATLSMCNMDNFICSGHKQLDLSISAYGEKELVYNLYPLRVGWQNLPELTLEYNTQADPTKDESQNNLLSELVQRSVPKKVFVLPPLKQQAK